MVSLEPSDIFLFQKYLKKDLERLFQPSTVLLWPANCAPDLFTPLLSANKIKKILSDPGPTVDQDGRRAFLPLIWQNQPLGIAIFSDTAGTDNEKLLAEQWPRISSLILEKVQIYKAYFTDAGSHTFNQALFKDVLIDLLEAHLRAGGKDEDNPTTPGREDLTGLRHPFSIVFVEWPNPAQDRPGASKQPWRDLAAAEGETEQPGQPWPGVVAAIKNGLQDIPFAYLFRLGTSILAVLLPCCDSGRGHQASLGLFRSLRNKGLFEAGRNRPKGGNHKFALGCLAYPPKNTREYRDSSPEKSYHWIIERAQETLAVAKSRPDYPVGFSTELEETAGLKTLKDIHQTVDQLRNLWEKAGRFSLVLAKYDDQNETDRKAPREAIDSWLPAGTSLFPCGQDSFFLYLPGMDVEEALRTGKHVQHQIREKYARTISMGLAGYPLLRYKKSEIPFNSYKALIHTHFFGPDTITAFDAVSLNISGDMLFNAGHMSGAIMEYKKGLALDAKDTNLLNSLGVCYAELGRYKSAISCFEKTLTIKKDSFMARYNLGSVYLKAGMPDKALLALEGAVSLDGNHFDSLFQLGRLLQEQKKWQEAVNYFQKAARCSEAKGYIHRYLGECYLALNLQKQAMAAFKKAVKINPADGFSLSRLGSLYAEMENDLEIAQALCQKALELDNENAAYWKTMGWIYYLQGNCSQAIQCLTEAQQRMKKDPEIYYFLGLVEQKKGNTTDARRKWQKALRINPLFKEAQSALRSLEASPK